MLKLDIEAWEWSVLDNIMETNLHKYIRHLLVEYHLFSGGILPPSDYVLAFQVSVWFQLFARHRGAFCILCTYGVLRAGWSKVSELRPRFLSYDPAIVGKILTSQAVVCLTPLSSSSRTCRAERPRNLYKQLL